MISLAPHTPAQRMRRYDCLAVERHLFGAWSLVQMWGRTGSRVRNSGIYLFGGMGKKPLFRL
jgi:hypothetical protein